jgi:hypothetical protein
VRRLGAERRAQGREPLGGGRRVVVDDLEGPGRREADVVMALDILDGRVLGVRSVINPDKLGYLGRVSDLARRKR